MNETTYSMNDKSLEALMNLPGLHTDFKDLTKDGFDQFYKDEINSTIDTYNTIKSDLEPHRESSEKINNLMSNFEKDIEQYELSIKQENEKNFEIDYESNKAADVGIGMLQTGLSVYMLYESVAHMIAEKPILSALIFLGGIGTGARGIYNIFKKS